MTAIGRVFRNRELGREMKRQYRHGRREAIGCIMESVRSEVHDDSASKTRDECNKE